MKKLGWWLTMPLLFCIVFGQMSMTSPVMADSGNILSCQTDTDIIKKDFGTKVPVILVHGLDGSPGQWTESDGSKIYEQISNRSDSTIVLNFSYTNGVGGYVGHGQRLGRDIDCASRISAANGGRGKVIVIGFSLGGVIGQIALNEHDPQGRLIGSKVGQFITVANANSRFPVVTPPTNVVTHAIAGDIINAYVKDSMIVSEHDTRADDEISVAGALSQYFGAYGVGGGTKIISCYRKFSDETYTAMTDNASCRHGELLKNYEVQSDIQSAITAYIHSLPPLPMLRAVRLTNLVVRFDNDWKFDPTSSDGYGPSDNAFAYEISTNHTILVEHYGLPLCTSSVLSDCAFPWTNPRVKLTPISPIVVDGTTSDFSFSYVNEFAWSEDSSWREGLGWCFTSKMTCFYIGRGSMQNPPVEVSDALNNVFMRTTWSN